MDENGIPPLLDLLVNNKACKANAALALAYLSYNPENKMAIMAGSGIPRYAPL